MVVADGHEFCEEEDEDGHKGDTLDPIILSDGACKTVVCKSIVGRGEELNNRYLLAITQSKT